ncbi:MAG: tRNA (adenosine(37)-N6)-dimethylallyltransferase MiaA [Angelakisella sp.]|nr:tRNA (adenosine(37)-N6)-dimethylallyltransferase MiaA [Angelakisella sp.]
MKKDKRIPLLVIVGPTASGKTKLSIELAKALNGEIVSADSMQTYRTMNIGTAKPTVEEQQGIKHHLIDCLEPNESFSVAQYVDAARKIIEDIIHRGKLPILTGGTGLYVNTLIDNINFSPAPSDETLRQQLREKAKLEGNGTVLELLREIDPQTASSLHENNLGRVIRAIEVYQTTGITMSEQIRRSRMIPSPYDVCILGLDYADRQVLYNRIGLRVDMMLQDGLMEEARQVLSQELSATAAQAIGYKELKGFFEGSCTLAEAAENLKQETRRYAKRQLTWFRRDKRIHWIYCDKAGSFDKIFEEAMSIVNHWKLCHKETDRT